MGVIVLTDGSGPCPVLGRELSRLGVSWEAWPLSVGCVDLCAAPPEALFVNAVTQGRYLLDHAAGLEYVREVVGWLEAFGRRVVNGSNALRLGASRVRQYSAARAAGLLTPRTVVLMGGELSLRGVSLSLRFPAVVRANRGPLNLGAAVVNSRDELEKLLMSGSFRPSPDRVTLVQEQGETDARRMGRVVFVGGEMVEEAGDGWLLAALDGTFAGRCARLARQTGVEVLTLEIATNDGGAPLLVHIDTTLVPRACEALAKAAAQVIARIDAGEQLAAEPWGETAMVG